MQIRLISTFIFSLFGALLLNTETKAEEIKIQENSIVKNNDNNTIIVYGRSEHKIGQAKSASEGSVSGIELRVRPILRPGEILETVPGLIATQHSGGGKANQYFLRGFNLDHGTDFAVLIDDFPVNFLTHGHGQGYLDINGLIPETISKVDYSKGPYRANTGDFSFAGHANITTIDSLRPFITTEIGKFDYQRYAIGGSWSLGNGEFLSLTQYKHQDGPWENPENFIGLSNFTKYILPTSFGKFRISLNIYNATWNPTDQIPERAINTILTNPYGSLDKDLKGKTEREIITSGFYGEDWRAIFWLQHYNWHLGSNFTFFLEDPVNGDEIRQFETMFAYGMRLQKNFQINQNISILFGSEGRIDDIYKVGFDRSIDGIPISTAAQFSVMEKSLGLYSELNWKISDKLSAIFGLRHDIYSFDTDAAKGVSWNGNITSEITSPKLGISYKFNQNFALYANWGEGFHSNDARGVTNPNSPAPGLVKGKMEEIGLRYEKSKLLLSLSYWQSEIDSELIYVGDSGSVEPSNGGVRNGYEFTAFWKPYNWLTIDATYSTNDGYLKDLPEGQNSIPGALEKSGEIGVTVTSEHWNLGGRIRYLGQHSLVEDNSAIGEATTLVNLRAAFMPNSNFEIYIDLLNALDERSHDIDYFYTTRLDGEPLDGVEDLMFHPSEPRQFRFGIKYKF